MAVEREVRVANRPAGPLVAFDGDCAFCRQWVRRWQGMTGDRVAYRPSAEIAGDYPEIGEGGFRARVWLIEPDGRARGGAGAVFRLYALAGDMRWPAWLYEHTPGVAGFTEAGYDLVAGHRDAAMTAIRLLWGSIDRRPSFRRTRSVFLRGIGLIYLAAFGSLAVQADGLIGSRGIAPAGEFLDRAGAFLGSGRFWQVPTLMWLDASDRTLHLLCWGGVVAAGFLAAGILAGEAAVLLWLAYLSLVSVGQPFLGYQWDALLLEAGLLAILMAPWNLRMGRARRGPPPGAIWLVRWLVFRLMFLSGMVKLGSGDPSWSSLEGDGLPLRDAAPADLDELVLCTSSPRWFQSGVGRLPVLGRADRALFRLRPSRRVRMVGFASIVVLQVLIAARPAITGSSTC